ncbi:MAG TPA: ComEC/Rec2 family competence protein, partial [Chloroflexota bacterium]
MQTRIPNGLVLASTFVLAILVGVWLAPHGHQLAQSIGIGLAAAGLAGTSLSVVVRRPIPAGLPLAFVAGLGLLRAATALAAPFVPWTEAPQERIEVVGRVDAAETRGTAGFVQVVVESVEATGRVGLDKAPAGMVRLTLPALPSIDVGDRVRVVGRFQSVDPNTASGQGLLRRGIVAVSALPDVENLGSTTSGPLALLGRLRSELAHSLERALPQPQAGLLVGLLVGGQQSMTEDLRQALIATGTTPLVVVSGYNITLVAGALMTALRGSAGGRAVIPIVGVWLFTLLAGLTGSSIRAALMATLAVGARRFGRGT